jgi:hypothetical protein
MRRAIARRSLLVILFILVLSGVTSAETVVIATTNRGTYNERGEQTDNSNFYVGDGRGNGCDYCGGDYRNFFVFDLAGVVQPIASAKLALSMPLLGFRSDGTSENYELHDVVTPISDLVNGTSGVAAHADLGNGVVYGSDSITDRCYCDYIDEIQLNASAIAAMNTSHGLFAMGGSITTLNDVVDSEFAFGSSPFSTAVLRLTLVPEPSTFFLLGIGAISLLCFRTLRPSDKVLLIK